MVNIKLPPQKNTFQTYNTIAKTIQEHKNLFCKVGPMDFSSYKQRPSTINYDIIQGDRNFNTKKGDKEVQFYTGEINCSRDAFEEEAKDFNYNKRRLFESLSATQDILPMTKSKLDISQKVGSKDVTSKSKPIYIVDMLVQQLAKIGLPFQPPKCNLEFTQENCDVIITVRKSLQNQDMERILCHKQILNKSSTAFKELFDLYIWDMENQEKMDIHYNTTNGLWKIFHKNNLPYIMFS